jgi:rhodanese-related sulfurtransferase
MVDMMSGSPVPTTSVDAIADPLPGDVAVLDVREPYEWVAGHVPAAVHIPLRELPGRIDDVPSGHVLVVCHVGSRSARATAFLLQQGVDAVNLGGGMAAWAAASRPMVSETGAPPVVV